MCHCNAQTSHPRHKFRTVVYKEVLLSARGTTHVCASVCIMTDACLWTYWWNPVHRRAALLPPEWDGMATSWVYFFCSHGPPSEAVRLPMVGLCKNLPALHFQLLRHYQTWSHTGGLGVPIGWSPPFPMRRDICITRERLEKDTSEPSPSFPRCL